MINILGTKAFKEDKLAITCKTEVDAIRLFEYLHDLGFQWIGSEVLTKENTKWEKYMESTTYNLNSDRTIQYSPFIFYKQENYRILDTKDVCHYIITPDLLYQLWMSEE